MNCDRDQIDRVQRLWEIECRRLLGALPMQEYRLALAAVLGACPEQNEPDMEASCE